MLLTPASTVRTGRFEFLELCMRRQDEPKSGYERLLVEFKSKFQFVKLLQCPLHPYKLKPELPKPGMSIIEIFSIDETKEVVIPTCSCYGTGVRQQVIHLTRSEMTSGGGTTHLLNPVTRLLRSKRNYGGFDNGT